MPLCFGPFGNLGKAERCKTRRSAANVTRLSFITINQLVLGPASIFWDFYSMAEDFYSRNINDYGYEGQIAVIREEEFPNLNGI